MGLKKKKSCTFSYVSSICIYSVERSLGYQCSDFIFLSSFPAAKTCSTNWLLKYFAMMYIIVQYEHSRRASESWEPMGSFSTNAGSREVIPVLLPLGYGPVVCPPSHVYWKEHGFQEAEVFVSSLRSLAMVCGGRGGGRERQKNWNGKLLEVLEKNRIRSICGSDENSNFLSAWTVGLGVLRGIENK